MNICKTAVLSLCLALSAGAAMSQEMKKDGMAGDDMKKMTMQECKDHMAMMKKDGMKKDDAMMMKKDAMCADMMKKDGMKKDGAMKDGAMKDPMKK